MTAKTYTLERIVDLLNVPMDRRDQCVKELLLGLVFADFAEAALLGPLVWTDDGDMSCALNNPDGTPQLTLRVKQ